MVKVYVPQKEYLSVIHCKNRVNVSENIVPIKIDLFIFQFCFRCIHKSIEKLNFCFNFSAPHNIRDIVLRLCCCFSYFFYSDLKQSICIFFFWMDTNRFMFQFSSYITNKMFTIEFSECIVQRMIYWYVKKILFRVGFILDSNEHLHFYNRVI